MRNQSSQYPLRLIAFSISAGSLILSFTFHFMIPGFKQGEPSIRVFQGYPYHGVQDIHRMKGMISNSNEVRVESEIFTLEQQRGFLEKYGTECYPSDESAVLKKYDQLDSTTQAHYQHELWKYCALAIHGGAYINNESPLLKPFLEAFPMRNRNYAIIGSTFQETIHGSLLILAENKSPIALDMIKIIVETSRIELDSNPLLLQKALYHLIAKDVDMDSTLLPLKPGFFNGRKNKWMLLEQRCANHHIIQKEYDNLKIETESVFKCSLANGFCCSITNPNDLSVIMMTRYISLPMQYFRPISKLPKPFAETELHSGSFNIPFISTVEQKVFDPSEKKKVKNLYEIFSEKKNLPEGDECFNCLRKKSGANCKMCKSFCPNFCKALCKVTPEEKFISKHLIVTPPPYKKDPSRLIPTIVHQTWFEPVTPEKYPNMSRLIESWKQSGWEYRFYDDNAASDFLSTHFPPEVSEAFHTLKPGAFKADLFRYCVLLINGGVYADMDVMLDSNLDFISDDIGFIIPMDEPGDPVNRRMCLWNGFLASAPAHPFLARVIELVVNNVRNRFTSVDIDNILCPDPELSISHAFDTLFTAGPCILGVAINFVLRRHLQTPFKDGDIDIFEEHDPINVNEIVLKSDDVRSLIPGRAIILSQNKNDMGAHRFTWTEKNLLVSSTDLPDADDRVNIQEMSEHPHYSVTHVRKGIYGLENLYADAQSANEEIRVMIKKYINSTL